MLNTKVIEVRQTGEREIRVLVNNKPEAIIAIENPHDSANILDCVRRAYAQAFIQAEMWGSLGYSLKLVKPAEFDTPYINNKPQRRRKQYGIHF